MSWNLCLYATQGHVCHETQSSECRLCYRALLQKRHVILRSLLHVATPYVSWDSCHDTLYATNWHMCHETQSSEYHFVVFSWHKWSGVATFEVATFVSWEYREVARSGVATSQYQMKWNVATSQYHCVWYCGTHASSWHATSWYSDDKCHFSCGMRLYRVSWHASECHELAFKISHVCCRLNVTHDRVLYVYVAIRRVTHDRVLYVAICRVHMSWRSLHTSKCVLWLVAWDLNPNT